MEGQCKGEMRPVCVPCQVQCLCPVSEAAESPEQGNWAAWVKGDPPLPPVRIPQKCGHEN